MKIKVYALQNLFIFYICIWTISPILAYGTVYRLLGVLSVFMWMILEIYNKAGIFRKISVVSLLIFVYIFYSEVLSYLSSDDYSFTSSFQLIIMLFFLLVYESRKNNLESMSWIFWGVLSIFPIWFYVTLRALDSIGGHVARVVVRNSDEAKDLVEQGVGGYGLVYSSVLLLPVVIGLLFYLISIRHTVKDKWLGIRKFYYYFFIIIINITLISMLLIKAGYSIALSTSFIAVIIVFLMRRFSYIKILSFSILALVFFLIQKGFISFFSSFLLSLTDDPVYTKKINDISFSLATATTSGSLDDRFIRYSQSLDSFFTNPFFGTISNEGIGGHSFLLDNYAKWGVFFGTLLLYCIIYIPLRSLNIRNKYFNISLAIIFVILFIFSLNTAVASFGVVIYLIVPYFYYFIESHRTEKST